MLQKETSRYKKDLVPLLRSVWGLKVVDEHAAAHPPTYV